jgi:hypothetical protein
MAKNDPVHAQVLQTLEARFKSHPQRHAGCAWPDVLQRLRGKTAALRALLAMEASGGEPDVIEHDHGSGQLTFCDCSAQSPQGRRSLCYDRAALDSRKENKPQGNAVDLARELGISLLTEAQYRALQTLGEFDTKTSSWVATPQSVRTQGGALFCDRRYGQVFTYHNGAESYYAARGFRGCLTV